MTPSTPPSFLSRVAIAIGSFFAILANARLAYQAFDEVFSTPRWQTLADDGATVLVSTHDLHALPRLADEAVLLLRRVLDVGGDAVALIVAETLFIAAFILVGIHYLGHA